MSSVGTGGLEEGKDDRQLRTLSWRATQLCHYRSMYEVIIFRGLFPGCSRYRIASTICWPRENQDCVNHPCSMTIAMESKKGMRYETIYRPSQTMLAEAQ
ncbi:hypothetical protein ACMFMG_003712 [Clarireedia jacksonii]